MPGMWPAAVGAVDRDDGDEQRSDLAAWRAQVYDPRLFRDRVSLGTASAYGANRGVVHGPAAARVVP
jgi:hypothetical protein